VGSMREIAHTAQLPLSLGKGTPGRSGHLGIRAICPAGSPCWGEAPGIIPDRPVVRMGSSYQAPSSRFLGTDWKRFLVNLVDRIARMTRGASRHTRTCPDYAGDV